MRASIVRLAVAVPTMLAGILALSSAQAREPDPRYPAGWWIEIPRDQAASWEILPQDAGPGAVIVSKRTELGILSNFTEAPFTLDGVRYRAVEGFWQMLKYPEGPNDPRATFPGITWPYTRQEVSQMIAFEAKHAGDAASANMRTMGINYVTYQGRQIAYKVDERGEYYELIVRAMRQKLAENPEVRRILLATGDLRLEPDHNQGDVPPAWRYCEIWMELRSELQHERGGVQPAVRH